jgi:uncharacterized membrane protein
MKFQVERIALFSDAVFAIAITLMVIEVKAPHLPHDVSIDTVMKELYHLFPSFMGIVLSFFLIGNFWLMHHQLMKYMSSYTGKLLRYNMAFLLIIIFIPFSTSFLSENLQVNSPVPLLFYNLNYILASLAGYRLFSYILDPANGVRVENIDEDPAQIKKEILFPLYIYSFVIVLAFIIPEYAALGYVVFAFENFFAKRKKKKKALSELTGF